MRFVFRRSGSLIGSLRGLIFAYGALGLFQVACRHRNGQRALTGVVTAVGTAPFFYDGFHLKVRREIHSTISRHRRGGTADVSKNGFLRAGPCTGEMGGRFLFIPLGALWLGAGAGRSE